MKQTALARVSGVHLRSLLYNYLLLTAGAVILAVNFDIFLTPAQVAPGGVSGIAIIINKFTGWLPGLIMLVLNIPLIILQWWT